MLTRCRSFDAAARSEGPCHAMLAASAEASDSAIGRYPSVARDPHIRLAAGCWAEPLARVGPSLTPAENPHLNALQGRLQRVRVSRKVFHVGGPISSCRLWAGPVEPHFGNRVRRHPLRGMFRLASSQSFWQEEARPSGEIPKHSACRCFVASGHHRGLSAADGSSREEQARTMQRPSDIEIPRKRKPANSGSDAAPITSCGPSRHRAAVFAGRLGRYPGREDAPWRSATSIDRR